MLEDKPDLFIQQALNTHCLINTAAMLSLQRCRAGHPVGWRPRHRDLSRQGR